MKNINRSEWLKVPNILSYFRILLIPFFVHYYSIATDLNGHLLAAGILFISGLTDAVDGIIARRFNQITNLGKLFDPIADKLTQLAVASVLLVRWPIMSYLLILFIIKEFSMFIFSYVLLHKGRMMNGAKWFGKVGTIVFYFCMFILVLSPEINHELLLTLVFTTAFFQVVAFVGYMKVFIAMYRDSNVSD